LVSSLEYISVDLFFYGCSRRCIGCHNPELWEFKNPNLSAEEIVEIVNLAERAKVVTLMGGEPLEQENLIYLLGKLRETGKMLSLCTGFKLNEIPREVLELLSFVKTGAYIDSDRTPFKSFLSSKNQIFYSKVNDNWEISWEYRKEGY
jgi:anaerobic ribonucleoside-triphosphate reductase activating protein